MMIPADASGEVGGEPRNQSWLRERKSPSEPPTRKSGLITRFQSVLLLLTCSWTPSSPNVQDKNKEDVCFFIEADSFCDESEGSPRRREAECQRWKQLISGLKAFSCRLSESVSKTLACDSNSMEGGREEGKREERGSPFQFQHLAIFHRGAQSRCKLLTRCSDVKLTPARKLPPSDCCRASIKERTANQG